MSLLIYRLEALTETARVISFGFRQGLEPFSDLGESLLSRG
jgi:hypothetical protein